MVVQQAEGEDVPAVPRDDSREDPQEGDTIEVVAKDRAAVYPARSDVVDPVRQVATANPGHVLTLSRTDLAWGARDTSTTLSCTNCHTATSVWGTPRGSDPRSRLAERRPL